MNGSGQRPGDAPRDPGARPGRPPEHAEFAVARVGSGSRWSPLALIGVVAVLMGLIGVAVGSRLATPIATAGPAAVAVPSATTVTPTTATPQPTAPDHRLAVPPVQTSDPSAKEIRLQVQRQQSGLFVHGDVYVAKVTWVFVSLRDATGTVTGFASVSVPGAAGPARGGGPTMRFDVELAVPSDFAGALTVQATAYDGTGHVIGATQLVIPATTATAATAATTSESAPVTLRTPAGRDGLITTAAVPVDGSATLNTSSVVVSLELDGAGPWANRIDTVALDTNPDGGLRPDWTPAFHVQLALPTPRPVGPAWVVVTTYDQSGNELATVRRAVLIGAAAGS